VLSDVAGEAVGRARFIIFFVFQVESELEYFSFRFSFCDEPCPFSTKIEKLRTDDKISQKSTFHDQIKRDKVFTNSETNSTKYCTM